jgi:hypothetical protein
MNAMTSSPRRSISTAILLGAASLAALVPVSAAAPTRARGASAKPKCATSGLVIWLNTTGNGAAGSIYYDLNLTNLSGHACTLSGYPGVSAVNLAGRQLGAGASRDSAQKPRLVTLAPGGGATVVLRIVEAGNFPSSSCREVTAAGLRVYPPGQASSKLVPFPFQACSRAGARVLSVRAVQPAP